MKFVKYGRSLGTRQLGKEAKKELDSLFDMNEDTIVLDFQGVDVVTNSFADEVLGKKIKEIGFFEFRARTTFKGLNEFTSLVIKKAIVNRVTELDEEWSHKLDYSDNGMEEMRLEQIT